LEKNQSGGPFAFPWMRGWCGTGGGCEVKGEKGGHFEKGTCAA
jgi:hypothetical protein